MDRARAALWAQRVGVGVVAAIVATLVLRVGTTASQQLAPRDPSVWLAARQAGALVQLNAVSGEVTARIDGVVPGGDDVSIAQAGAGAFVLNRTKGELTFIDPVTQKAGQKTPAANAQAVVVTAGQARLITADAVAPVGVADGRVGTPVPLDGRLTAPALAADGTLWGLRDGQLVAVRGDVTPLAVPEGLRLAGLAAAAGTAAIIDAAGPGVVTLDGQRVALGARGCLAEAPTGQVVTGGSAAGDTGAWVLAVDSAAGRLLSLDQRGGHCGATALAAGRVDAGAPVEVGGYAYVPLRSSSEVVVVRLADDAVVARAGVGPIGAAFEVLAKDGIVWFNDPDGNRAGVIGSDGQVRAIDKTGAASAVANNGSGAPGEGSGGALGTGTIAPTGTRPSGTAGSAGTGGTGATPGTSGEVGETPRTGGSGGTRTGSTGTGGAGAGVGPSATGTGSELEQPSPDILVADFTFTSRVVEVDQAATFTDRSTGGPTAWTWDFGDGTFASGPRATKTWRQAGTYTVTLRVDNALGSNTASATIQVVTPDVKVRPKADFSFSQQRVEAGTPITFSDRSKGNPTELRWNFGDGTTASGSTVTKTYPSAGTFVVTLVASNNEGSDSTQATIQVFDKVTAPVAGIDAVQRDAQVGQGLVFLSRVSGNPTELRWGFGDGGTALGAVARHAWDAPGTYTVTLTASNTAGSSQASVTVTIREAVVPPQARATPGSATVRENEALRLTSVSINNPTSTSWDFGDGTTGSGTSVSKAWARAGTYVVTLRVANSAGESSTTVPVNVVSTLPAPVASFTFTPSAPTTLTPVLFKDASTGAASWAWDFGDGSPPSSLADPTHVYERTGTFTVRLTVTNSTGTNSTTRVVTVTPPPPVAGFLVTPATPLAGAVAQFSDVSTGGAATAWTWDFGDASPVTTVRNPTHTYAAAGNYTVRFTVSNAAGVSTITRVVAVSPPPPVAAITVAPASPVAGAVTQFTDSSTGGLGSTFLWEFGDGLTSALQNPTHIYAAAGPYTVKLTVTNVSGTSTATRAITVVPPLPIPSFTFAPVAPQVGQLVTFTNTSTGGAATSWLWDFDDTTSFAGATPPPHAFAVAKTYAVRLTATNAAGSVTATVNVSINPITPPPTAVINAPLVVTAGVPAAFTATVTGGVAPLTYAWTFPGATPAAAAVAAPSTTWAAAGGPFTVTLVVTDALGRPSVLATRAVTVVPPPPTADFTFAPAAPTAGQAVTFTSSVVNGSGPFTFQWTVTGGVGMLPAVPAISTLANPVITLPSAGSYTVTLVVTDSMGRPSAPVVKVVTVAAPPPPPTVPPAVIPDPTI